MEVLKIQFNSLSDLNRALEQLTDVQHVQLGTSIIVIANIYNRNVIADAKTVGCGYTVEPTQFDIDRVINHSH